MVMIEDLMKNEVKKVKKFATCRNNVEVALSGWWTEKQTDCDIATGFVTVVCEVCTYDYEKTLDNVYIHVCLWDRRRSFVDKYRNK